MSGARRGVLLGVVGLVLLSLAGLGAVGMVSAFVTRPHTYDVLASRGVPATATLVRCAAGLGGGRGTGCELSLTYRGATRTWAYGENSAQFAGLPAGSAVRVLVDPQHPGTVYTRTDVAARTNTGWGPVAWLSVAALVLAAGLTAALLRQRTRLRRLRG